jgi:hypothetical protein
MDGSWGMDGDRMGEHGRWVHGVRNIALEMLHVSMGICLRGLGCSDIKMHAKSPFET